jgi:hypothetical protein
MRTVQPAGFEPDRHTVRFTGPQVDEARGLRRPISDRGRGSKADHLRRADTASERLERRVEDRRPRAADRLAG